MTDTEYLNAQLRIIQAAKDIAELPLVPFIQRLDKALAIGPILDPTLYRAASVQAGALLNLAKALHRCACEIHGQGPL